MTPSTEELISWHELRAPYNHIAEATVAALRRLQAFERAEVVLENNDAPARFYTELKPALTLNKGDRVLIVRGINETTT